MPHAAFDVDLGRIHGYASHGLRVCYNSPEWPFGAVRGFDFILVEVASPVDTSSDRAQAFNRRKWMIGNSLLVGRLMHWALDGNYDHTKILVSPANKWTLGHEEKMRDQISGCAGEDNHDIRACRAMLHYHATNPEQWVPLMTYFTNLSKAARKTKGLEK